MQFNITPYLQVFRNRRIGAVTLLGFASGLPLALTGGTLQAWLTVSGIDIQTIGIFVLIGLPYTMKFLWSPFMDRYVPPLLGRRRGWIVITQICLIAGIMAMALNSPLRAPWLLGAIALMVAFSSASQDIVIDAYRTDVLREKERGVGVAVFVTGYRVAMLVSGAMALVMSEYIGWQNTYLLMAGLMSIGIVSSFFAPEPEEKVLPPANLQDAVWGPLKEYFLRPSAISLIALIVLYKLSDSYAGALTTAFLIRGVGFSAGDVGTINKGLGLICVVVGALFGGTLMVRLGLFRSLLFFGILQVVSNLSFMVLAWLGKDYGMLIFAVAFENLSGGMGTSAFISLLMAMCNLRYSATQYALLTSISALGRVFIAPTSGFLVDSVGWPNFFFVTAIVGLPGLWLLWRLRKEIENLSQG